jgi:hypothetical protein
MQRKPIANKYRKGTMKSTLQARLKKYASGPKIFFRRPLSHIIIFRHASKGVKKRVKSPNRHPRKKKFFFFFLAIVQSD